MTENKTIILSPETVAAYHEIKEKGVNMQTIREAMYRKPENWKRLFDFYNQFNKPVGMGCFPCYTKVFTYVNQVMKDNGHD